MIANTQKNELVFEDLDNNTSIGMSIDMDSANTLMQMLSTNLYSDPVGSTIREVTSNALDSHRRAGVDEPIIVTLTDKLFSVEDFGLGLDNDDVENIISKYGKSTKRNSSVELGMFGLGFKAPLSYSSSFTFIARKNNVERIYIMMKGSVGNEIKLLSESYTEERNGVKVCIDIKSSDRPEFVEQIATQLRYFKNVYFNIYNFKNDYKIYRSDNYQFLLENPFPKYSNPINNQIHLCLDDVYYPIDWDKIGISVLYSPIALRFSLTDGIYPTPNREAIIYTSDTINKIQDKLKVVSNEIVTKYNEYLKTSAKVTEIIESNGSYNVNMELVEGCYFNVNVKNFEKLADVKIEKVPLPNCNIISSNIIYNNSYRLFKEYSYTYAKQSNDKKARRTSNFNYRNIYSVIIDKRYNVYINDLTNSKEHTLKRSYIEDNDVKDFVIIKKDENGIAETLYDSNEFVKHRDVSLIKAFDAEVKMIKLQILKENCIYLSEVIVPNEFKVKYEINNSKSKSPKLIKSEGQISLYKALNLTNTNKNSNCKFERYVENCDKLSKYPFLNIYGLEKDKATLNLLYGAIKTKNVNIYYLSKKEYDVLESLNMKNWISLDNYLYTNNKYIANIKTAYLYLQYRGNLPLILTDKCHWALTDLKHELSKVLSISKEVVGMDSFFRKHIVNVYPLSTLVQNLKLDESWKNEKVNLNFTYFEKMQNIIKFMNKETHIRGILQMLSKAEYMNNTQVNSYIDIIRDICKRTKVKMLIDSKNYKFKE